MRPLEHVPIDILKLMMHFVELNSDQPLIEHLCKKKELVECIDIGKSTIIRYNMEIVKQFGPKNCHGADIYGMISVLLGGDVLSRRYKDDCYISFHVKEDTGFSMDTKLIPANEASKYPTKVFTKRVAKGKLKGKFTLEVLFVDAEKIGEKDLCDKYVANINTRFENSSDETSLKEKVKKAEKWHTDYILLMEQTKKKRQSQNVNNATETSQPNDESPCLGLTDLYQVDRFPESGKFEHMFADRWFISFPEKACSDKTDRAAVYAHFAHEIFKKYCSQFILRNTHTMFEFLLMNGQRIVTKLRPYAQNGENMLAATIKEHHLSRESLKSLYNVTIYAVDMPGFAPPKRVKSRLDFIRSRLEGLFICKDYITLFQRLDEKKDMIKDRCVTVDTPDECTEPFEKNCDCEKLHVSNYCDHVELLLHKNCHKILLHRWSISVSDLCLKMHNDTDIKQVFLRIANRVIHNNFNDNWNVGTNVLCEIEVDGKIYSSELRHHSEVAYKTLFNEMFSEPGEKVGLLRKVVVSVYVMNILKFATNEEARECLDNFRTQYRKITLSNAKLPVKTAKNKNLEKGISRKGSPQSGANVTSSTGEISFMLNISDFRRGSGLATKASIEPIRLENGYKIVSTKYAVNTGKDRILLFSVEILPEFYENVLDSRLFLAKICLDIAKFNEIHLWSKKTKKITVKISDDSGFMAEFTLDKKDQWNSVLLKEEIMKYGGEITEKFHLYVYYRTM